MKTCMVLLALAGIFLTVPVSTFAAPLPWDSGNLRASVIVVSFSDAPWDGDMLWIREVTTQRLPAYYYENSYGKLTISPTVFGPYALPIAFSALSGPVFYSALIAATDPDIDFSQYDCLVIVRSGRIGGGEHVQLSELRLKVGRDCQECAVKSNSWRQHDSIP